MGTLSSASFLPRIIATGEGFSPYRLDSTNNMRLHDIQIGEAVDVEIAEITGRDGGLFMGRTVRATPLTVSGYIQSVNEDTVDTTWRALRAALKGKATDNAFDFYWYYDVAQAKYTGWEDCWLTGQPWKQKTGTVPGRYEYPQFTFSMVTTSPDPTASAASADYEISGSNVVITLTSGGSFKIVDETGAPETVLLVKDGILTVKNLRESGGQDIS